MKRTETLLLLLLFPLFLQAQFKFTVSEQLPHQVQIQSKSGEPLLFSPATGLWEIYTDWQAGWPTQKKIITADSLERINGYAILHGKLSIEGGVLRVRDSYKREGNRIKCTRLNGGAKFTEMGVF